MALTVPPGKPRSLPHRSRRYCDSERFGSSALAVRPEITRAVTITHTATPKRTPLRQELELLNDDLDGPCRRCLRAAEVIKNHAGCFGARGRNPRRELALGDDRRCAAFRAGSLGLECRRPGLPPQRVRQRSHGGAKSKDV